MARVDRWCTQNIREEEYYTGSVLLLLLHSINYPGNSLSLQPSYATESHDEYMLAPEKATRLTEVDDLGSVTR